MLSVSELVANSEKSRILKLWKLSDAVGVSELVANPKHSIGPSRGPSMSLSKRVNVIPTANSCSMQYNNPGLTIRTNVRAAIRKGIPSKESFEFLKSLSILEIASALHSVRLTPNTQSGLQVVLLRVSGVIGTDQRYLIQNSCALRQCQCQRIGYQFQKSIILKIWKLPDAVSQRTGC